MAVADQPIPRDGTRAAVRYWAARTREALRFAEALLDEPDLEAGAEWATDAAGCASEFEVAAASYKATRRRVI